MIVFPKDEKVCHNPDHDPPCFIQIPFGAIYIHRCPSCKREIILRNDGVKY